MYSNIAHTPQMTPTVMYGYETLSAMLRGKYMLKMAVKRMLTRKSESKGKEEDAENCTINYTICLYHTPKIVAIIKKNLGKKDDRVHSIHRTYKNC